jgi:probable rRNA maturation factor
MTTDDPDPHPRRLQVTVTDGRGRPKVARGLAVWLTRVAPRRTDGELTIALVGDRKMRALSRQFRDIDRVTDVLSFPADPGPRATGVPQYLGDIVIATGRAARQARVAGLTESQEHRRLALHGLLHLLGYDHERDDGRMERLERRLRRQGGLPVE